MLLQFCGYFLDKTHMYIVRQNSVYSRFTNHRRLLNAYQKVKVIVIPCIYVTLECEEFSALVEFK